MMFDHARRMHVPIQNDMRRIDSPTKILRSIQAEEYIAKYGSDFEVYWNWDELPDDALLVRFRIPNSGSIAYEGKHKRKPDFPDFCENGENFQVSYRIDKLAGYAVEKEERRVLRDAASKYIKENNCKTRSNIGPQKRLHIAVVAE